MEGGSCHKVVLIMHEGRGGLVMEMYPMLAQDFELGVCVYVRRN